MDATVFVPVSTFEVLGASLMNRAVGLNVKQLNDRKFKVLFGVTSEMCSVLWEEIENKRPPDVRTIHLLWAGLFLKVYGKMDVLSTIAGIASKR